MTDESTLLTSEQAGKRLRYCELDILTEWEARSRAEVPAAREQEKLSLTDSLPEFLDILAQTLEAPNGVEPLAENREVAREHAEDRARARDYTLGEVIEEYHLLRQVIFEVLEAEHILSSATRRTIHCFLDQGIRIAGERFMELTQERQADTQTELYLERSRLELSIRELEEERKMRERFVAALTHDLRTPMTAVKLTAQLIRRKFANLETIHPLLDRIISGVNRADSMIHDLLDANRIKAGEGIPITLIECDLDTMLCKAVADLVTIYGTRFEYIHEGDSVQGLWDPTALQRMVENLVSNAVKYGSPNTKIKVQLRTLPDRAEISVHNQGPPISEADQRILFTPYRRTDSAVRGNQKGWGIGLALVKGIVEAHHGKLILKSEERAGTTFTAQLPLGGRALRGSP